MFIWHRKMQKLDERTGKYFTLLESYFNNLVCFCVYINHVQCFRPFLFVYITRLDIAMVAFELNRSVWSHLKSTSERHG